MLQKYLMAVDAGTGSVRAVLFDLDGNQVDCVQKEWEHAEDPRWPGSMDFDWEYNWKLACQCIQEVIRNSNVAPKNIVAISTTCMREGIVLYDENNKEIWACANVDARSTDEVSQLINMDAGLEKEIYNQSGQSFALGALPRILWVKNKMPEIYNKIHTVGMFNDWLIFKLTGVLEVEPSNGSTTGIFDLEKRCWDAKIAKKCGLRDDIFPPVRECGKLIAKVNEACSKQTGLAIGTPVVVGGGDCQLGCIGVGVVNNNQAAIFGGSFWQYEHNTNKVPKTDSCTVRINCHAIENMWQYEALAFKPGLVMRWFRDGFCQLEKKLAAEQGKDPYYLMDKEAEKIPVGCHGMLCAFSNIMDFMNWKHASPTFTNFNLDAEKYNKYTFYRCILENTALVTKGHMDLVCESAGERPNAVVFAGGASKSPLWCQILSDVLGVQIKVPVVKEATALGAAILAGFGVGLFDSVENAASHMVKWDKTYYPNMENHKVYCEIYENWKQVYHAQLALCDQKLTRNMWIAPGL